MATVLAHLPIAGHRPTFMGHKLEIKPHSPRPQTTAFEPSAFNLALRCHAVTRSLAATQPPACVCAMCPPSRVQAVGHKGPVQGTNGCRRPLLSVGVSWLRHVHMQQADGAQAVLLLRGEWSCLARARAPTQSSVHAWHVQ